jgi:uncharacterized membrane protein/thiol-disulfide isomerase/thioredoxin
MATTFNTKLPAVAARYAHLQGIKITKTTLIRDLEENPNYPSLLGLSDTFDRYGIPNTALHLPGESLDQMQTPFIAYAKTPAGGQDFVLVRRIEDKGPSGKTITVDLGSGLSRTMPMARFLKDYKEIVWTANTDGRSEEKDFAKKRTAEYRRQVNKRGAIFLIGVGLLALVDTNLAVGYPIPLFVFMILTKLAGTAISLLLLGYETGNGSDLVQDLCQTGAQTNCSAVLDSRASKLGGISWSEIGFIYFAATLSGLLFPGLTFGAKAWWLCWGALLAVCYMPFSLYYQWRVVRRWCPLCLAIQTMLIFECGWSLWIFKNQPLAFSSTTLPAVLVCSLLPIVIWFFVKPLLQRSKDGDQYRGAYRRLRSNPELFHGLLMQQPHAPDGWQDLGIVLGNPNAPVTMIEVCNVFCGACARTYPILDEIMQCNGNVQLRLIFIAQDKASDQKAKVINHFITLAAKQQPGLIQQAIADWYLAPKKDYEQFSKKYPLKDTAGTPATEVERMNKWCREAAISATPAIFLNGYRLPEDYTPKDLAEIFFHL